MTASNDIKRALAVAVKLSDKSLAALTVDTQAIAERIAELEVAIRHAKVMADHGVHGEMGAIEACDEIHRALSAVVPSR